MAYDKLFTLLKIVHKKTKEGNIEWKKTGTRERFKADFAGASVMVSHEAVGEEGSLTYVFRILDKNGKSVESATYPQLAHSVGIESYDLLSETYDAARNQATGQDETLDTLLRELGD